MTQRSKNIFGIFALAALSLGVLFGLVVRGEKQIFAQSSLNEERKETKEKRYVCREDLVESGEESLAMQQRTEGAEVVDCVGIGCGVIF